MKRKKWNKQRGFTLIELLVVIAIVGVLFILILPALASTRERAHAINCMNNMKQIAIAAFLYADDHDEEIPDVTALELLDYVDDEDVYLCPRDSNLESDGRTTSYRAYSGTPSTFLPSDINGLFSETILYIETDAKGDKANIELARDGEVEKGDINFRHDNRTVIVFADGHIFSMNEEQLVSLHGISPGDKIPDHKLSYKVDIFVLAAYFNMRLFFAYFLETLQCPFGLQN